MSDETPFEVLGIDAGADDKAVRKAFAAKLREAKAAGDTARVEQVQRAFEAVRDAPAREQVAQIGDNKGRIEELLKEAQEALEKKDTEKALARYEEVLELVPECPPALFAILMIRMERNEVALAQKVADRLCEADPNDPRPWAAKARVLATAASRSTGPARVRQFSKALECARKSRELGDTSAGPLVLESRLLEEVGKLDEARTVVADPLETTSDLRTNELDLFLRLLWLDAGRTMGRRLEKTLQQLRERLPESRDQLRSIAYALGDLSCQLANASKLGPALRVCEFAATACLPNDPRLEELARSLKKATTAPAKRPRIVNRAPSRPGVGANAGRSAGAAVIIAVMVVLRLIGAFATHSGSSYSPPSYRYQPPPTSPYAPGNGGWRPPQLDPRPGDPNPDPFGSPRGFNNPGGFNGGNPGGFNGGNPGGFNPGGGNPGGFNPR